MKGSKNSFVTLGLSSTGSYKRVKVGEAEKLKVKDFSLEGFVGGCSPTPRGNCWGMFQLPITVGKTISTLIFKDKLFLMILWVGWLDSSLALCGVI